MKKNGISGQKGKAEYMLLMAVVAATVFFLGCNPAFAANEMKTVITEVLDSVIYPIFAAIGVLLGAYGVGMLVLSFKNSDPDAQARATQALVAAIALIGIRVLIGNLHLEKYL